LIFCHGLEFVGHAQSYHLNEYITLRCASWRCILGVRTIVV
jgi:hypothetical protein